jgi:hypothetical protein
MANKASQGRYAGGGQVKYLVYQSPQPMRTGRVQQRTRVHGLYFPANARSIRLGEPGTVQKRTGRRVHGVAVHHQHHLPRTSAQRGRTRYRVPERWAERTKVVELPEGAKSVKLSNQPPAGPKMAVR